MQKCIGVINGGLIGNEFGPLCNTRPAYMLPFAGRYRLIDIALSNMANNDFSNVVLYGGKLLRSTLDHIGNGKPWELNRRRNGLVMFPPSFRKEKEASNEIKAYYDTLRFYEDSKEKYLFFVDPMIANKTDLTDPYEEFREKDYDVMLFYKSVEDPLGKYIHADKLIFNGDNRLKNIGTNLATEDVFNLLAQIGFMKKDVFISIIKECMEEGDAFTLKDALRHRLNQLNVGVYKMKSFIIPIRDIRTYYDANMRLLDRELYDHIFFENGLVLTKSKDEPSALYLKESKVENSLVANGCVIEGEVENSIIFRGVRIGKGAIIKNSILFQDSIIKPGAVVVNSILDKNVYVKEQVSLVGTKIHPYIVEKNLVVE
ncbi:MAG: glucose-1-phosphate adenylyltransferase subunit GlgD [Tissierellia bacterium]|nr:glucose-1-phosphate adenylyltransferase subunit GlgD [Tissierellia bacterium]